MGERRESKWWDAWGKWWDTWGAPVTAIATGFAYGVGYASAAYFASILNVSPADLGLDLRDYLLLTGLTGIAWGLVVAVGASLVWVMGSEWFNRSRPRLKHAGAMLLAAVLGLAMAGLVILFFEQTVTNKDWDWPASLFYIGIFIVFIVGVFTSVSLLGQDSSSAHRTGWVILLLVVVIVTPTATLAGARNWAQSLVEDARNGDEPDEGPFPLRLVLEPEIGTANIETDGDTETACVLRVGERVFLGAETVVVRDVTSFTRFTPSTSSTSTTVLAPEEPDIDAVPWSDPSGASSTSDETSC